MQRNSRQQTPFDAQRIYGCLQPEITLREKVSKGLQRNSRQQTPFDAQRIYGCLQPEITLREKVSKGLQRNSNIGENIDKIRGCDHRYFT